jgi:hypothetical protein
MTTVTPSAKPDVLIETSSLYVGIFDEGSPVNRLEYLSESFEAAKRKAARDGVEEFFSLFLLNDQLIQAGNAGDLLAWTLLFDGVFRAAVQVIPESAKMEVGSMADLGAATSQALLACPTGRLLVSCLGSLGTSQTPVAILAPGNYLVSLGRDEDAESRHILLGSVSEYPMGEGPDWKITIQRVIAHHGDA